MNHHYTEQQGFIRVMMIPALLMFVCTFAGCGSSEPEKVIGTVTISVAHDGKPVTEGTVNMIEIGSSKSATGTLNETGNLTLENVEVGKYTVSILPPPLPPADPDQPPVPIKNYPNIPDKYRSETTSPLSAEVKEGTNEFQFELK